VRPFYKPGAIGPRKSAKGLADLATDEFTQGLYERADEIESERAEQSPPDDDDEGRWRSADSYVGDVRGMFDGLHSDLKEK
jgi:hypothetical protein